MSDGTTLPQTAMTAPGTSHVASDRTRVWFVAGAALSYSLLGVLSHTPGIGAIANYSGIVAGISFTIAYVLLNLKNVRLRLAELVYFLALSLAVPFALLQSQSALDVVGNFIRASFLIAAVLFWRERNIEIERLIPQLYSAFWRVAVIVTLFTIAMRVAQVPIGKANHVPVLIFLFAVALSRWRIMQVIVLLAMVIVSGKDTAYLAILAIAATFVLMRGKLTFGILLFLIFIVFALSPANPVILSLNALGGNFARVSEFLLLVTTYQFDEDLLNLILSNRYLEYVSVFQDWADNGIPFLGRGLGATVLVELGWANEFVERSTLHNSFLVIFHTTGFFGLSFVFYYVFIPAWRLRKIQPEVVLAVVGCVVYALFSNTLLQAPSLVFTFALAKRLSEISYMDRKLRK